jgi:hypothetical protein
MISYENCPQCPCGNTFPYWQNQVKHSEALNGRFELKCHCGKELYVHRVSKDFFDVSVKGAPSGLSVDHNVQIDKEMTAYSLFGKRPDGTFYVTGLFSSKDAAIRFRDEHHFDLIGIAELKGTFKLFESDLKRK